MRIGYLHIGPPQHGIRRYGQFIASEAQRRPDLTVIEADVTLTQDRRRNREMLVDAAQQLSQAEVIHFQFNRSIWGGKSLLLIYHLWIFLNNCSRPLVVTLHDVFLPTDDPQKPKQPLWRNTLDYIKSIFKPDVAILRWLLNQTQQTLVCTEEEEQRIYRLLNSTAMKNSGKVKIIPHFVEERTVTVDPTRVRRELGLDGVKTVTLLGWIYPGKGHDLALGAMTKLPGDVKLIFAGRPSDGCEKLAEELLEKAKTLGVADRLRITGYLSEEDLERYLVATDIAICPFETFSASGSLSTWISVGHLILASDLPQIREYNQLTSGAIKTFYPYTSSALSEAIQQILSIDTEDTKKLNKNTSVIQLRQKLCMPVIFNQHLIYYRRVADNPVFSNHKAVTAEI